MSELEILLNHLSANQWNSESINQVKMELEDFAGIVAVRKHEILYSYSKAWKANKEKALAILRKRQPKAIFFEIGL